jgi:hypothetical protein
MVFPCIIYIIFITCITYITCITFITFFPLKLSFWQAFAINTCINYAGNSVRLTYEDRDDTYTSYQAGSKLQQTKRSIAGIRIVVNTELGLHACDTRWYGNGNSVTD